MAGFTLLRQEDDIRGSDAYGDQVAPSEANFETNPVELETDLNNIRSAINRILHTTQSGNDWFATATRGLDDIETDLTSVEDKTIICGSQKLQNISVPANVKATETLTISGAITDLDQVEVGGQTYTLRTPFVDAANNIDASGSIAQTCENIRRAINDDGVAGANYGTGTVANASVTATDTATTVVATAIVGGTQGNSITCTDPTDSGGVLSWAGVTLSGGAGDVVTLVVASSETPSQTAAVGAAAIGAIVAVLAGDVGTADLAEQAGANALSPKNLVIVRDASTKDGLTSNGQQIYGLIQAESGTADGEAFNDTDKQVQITFVRHDGADDLEVCPGEDIGGSTIEYLYPHRITLSTLPEDCTWPPVFTDQASDATVTRQNAYNNQSTTPVELANNADLDLAAAREWFIRDALNADLFGVIEGSGGGTSTVRVASDVDEFDSDAVDNDFLNGGTFGTTGTGIQIAETAGVIERAADLIMRASGSGELIFDDSYRSGSTWSLNGIRLADSIAEWSAFETEFGEVSLLDAIKQAADASGTPVWSFHVVTVAAAADADVSGPSGARTTGCSSTVGSCAPAPTSPQTSTTTLVRR
jgi:hypothetical protein